MSAHVWVVEMFSAKRWKPMPPVAYINLSTREAEILLQDWKDANPDERFRLCKYTRDSKP